MHCMDIMEVHVHDKTKGKNDNDNYIYSLFTHAITQL